MRTLVWFLVVVWCQTVAVIYGYKHDYIKQFAKEKTFVADVRAEFVEAMENVEEFCGGTAIKEFKCWQKKFFEYCGLDKKVCSKHKDFDNCSRRCKRELTHALREKMYDALVMEKCEDKCKNPATYKCLDCKSEQWSSVVSKL